MKRSLSRLAVTAGVVLSAILAATAANGGVTVASTHVTARSGAAGFPTVTVSAGTSVPQMTVNFGMRPVANDCIYVIGMKQGWFKDVGITIAPAPLGFKSTFNDAVPLLVNRQLNVEGLDPIPTISTLKSVKSIRFIALSDLFIGYQILAAPSTHLKPVSYYVSHGMSFKAAMRKALAPLKGQTFTVPPIISDRGFLNLAFQSAGMDMMKDTKVQVVQDSTALNLASGGRTRFATFDGAPFTAQLLGAGWIPLVTPLDLAKGLPGGPTSKAELLVEPPGLASPESWARQNPDTVLRFTSVMFRIIDAINRNPQKELAYELPFINAFAGTKLTLHELQHNIQGLDPLIGFAQQKPYFDNPNSTLYYRNWFQATLKYNIDKGLVPKGSYSADDLIWAGPVYHQLVHLKQVSKALMGRLSRKGGSLSASKRALLTKARAFYKAFDYLDAYRFLLAANK